MLPHARQRQYGKDDFRSKSGKVTTTPDIDRVERWQDRTVTTTGTNAAGQTVNNVAVYDRQ
jgi:hypothetical protein